MEYTIRADLYKIPRMMIDRALRGEPTPMCGMTPDEIAEHDAWLISLDAKWPDMAGTLERMFKPWGLMLDRAKRGEATLQETDYRLRILDIIKTM